MAGSNSLSRQRSPARSTYRAPSRMPVLPPTEAVEPISGQLGDVPPMIQGVLSTRDRVCSVGRPPNPRASVLQHPQRGEVQRYSSAGMGYCCAAGQSPPATSRILAGAPGPRLLTWSSFARSNADASRDLPGNLDDHLGDRRANPRSLRGLEPPRRRGQGDPGPAAEQEAVGAAANLSVIVVTYNSASAVRHSLPPLTSELRAGDELIVCDNGSSDGTSALVRQLAPGALVLEGRENLGFGAACNAGARAAHNELLLFLNPDVVVQPGFRAGIELPHVQHPDWGCWQALVTSEGGRTVNTWGGVVHFTGIAWAGGAGRPAGDAPREPREVSFASGACLAVRGEAWKALGGFSEEYFLYHEDTDLGLRMWLHGYGVGIEPRAVCDHHYEFAKGAHKWRYLERNRWATLVRTYPTPLLLLLLPALLATELALLGVAWRGGWLRAKLQAVREGARWMPRLWRERQAITSSAACFGPRGRPAAAGFADRLTPRLDSEYLGAASRSRPLNSLLTAHWRAVRALV
jgi:N-acetylglucosaminyl-diphospho-decaprenol L-rhamnosyltransferase